MIGGVDGDFNQESRREGYRGGVMISGGIWLSEVYPTDKSADGAREAMEQIMEKHPDGVGIVACYNDLLAVTAIEMAKGNDAFSDTVFIGFDGNGSVCERIMEDEHYENLVTVAQNPYEMGFGAVKMLSDYWKNGEDGIPEDGTVKSDGTNRMPADSGNMTAESSAMTDQAGQGEVAAEEEHYIDSGYSVITKVNVQERMGQIRNHLS
jgi:ABC-type sugar transport system substrate-binding protein